MRFLFECQCTKLRVGIAKSCSSLPPRTNQNTVSRLTYLNKMWPSGQVVTACGSKGRKPGEKHRYDPSQHLKGRRFSAYGIDFRSIWGFYSPRGEWLRPLIFPNMWFGLLWEIFQLQIGFTGSQWVANGLTWAHVGHGYYTVLSLGRLLMVNLTWEISS